MKTKIISTILLSLILFTGCDDNSTEPSASAPAESATISGTITFIDECPIENVTVSLSANWLPTGPPSAYDVITPSDLNSNGEYSYLFENITFGPYAAIAVAWDDPDDNDPATEQHVLGALGGEYPYLPMYGQGTYPDSITVSVDDNSKTGLDFSADCNYAVGSGQ